MKDVQPQTQPSVLRVRVSAAERAVLETAAEDTHTTIGDFMRREAVRAAEIAILNRAIVTVIPAADWEAFEAWVSRPAATIPALCELAERVPTWER